MYGLLIYILSIWMSKVCLKGHSNHKCYCILNIPRKYVYLFYFVFISQSETLISNR